MIRAVYRKPQWHVVIKRIDFESTNLSYSSVSNWSKKGVSVQAAEFVSSPERSSLDNVYTDLIGYSYSNSIADPRGEFTLSFVPSADSKGLTWKDKIETMDMVRIYEFGQIRYEGFVKTVDYSSEMAEAGPRRTVSVTGCSFGGKIQEYNLTLNVYLWYNQGGTADTINSELVSALGSGSDINQPLENILKVINDKFFEVVFGSQTLKGFINWIKQASRFVTGDMRSYYPRLFNVFQVDQNNLWDIYRQILTYPIYEIFGKYNAVTRFYEITCRETPFDLESWNNLKITKINPLYLKGHHLSKSDNQVYSHYYSTMPNTTWDENENYASVDLTNTSLFDTEKLWKYGYKQMMANFSFFDKDVGNAQGFNAEDFLRDNSLRMYAWFKNNDKFESGNITLMTVPNESGELIDIGERVKYLGGQFYVEGYRRTMNYPGQMLTELSVTRGYIYGETKLEKDGTIQRYSGGDIVLTPQVKPIREASKAAKLVEREALDGKK